jgi:hypothetical protein
MWIKKDSNMKRLDSWQILFVIWGFAFQVILIVHFALRKWAFERYTWRFGWIVYALSVPAAIISLILLIRGQPWAFWTGGLIYLVWAAFGYWIEYVLKIKWRNPPRWPILGPYVLLYLATNMFYWWPMGLIGRPLWYVYAVLFAISTALNVLSHR